MVAPPKPTRKRTRVRISKSGQVTLPAQIRARLGVERGEYIEFVEGKDGSVTVRPSKLLTLDEIMGMAGPRPENLDELLREARRFGSVRERYRIGEGSDDLD